MTPAGSIEGDKPSGPRSRKGVQTRARLLDAAKQVFEELGFLDARVSDIAEKAGLSHGSFYHYFDSKEQVFRELAAVLDEQLSAPLGEIILARGSQVSPRERIREAVSLHLSSYRDEARIMGVIEQVSRYDQEVAALRIARHQQSTELIAGSIRDLQRRGMADLSLDPFLAASGLGALVNRFVEMWLVEGMLDSPLEECVEQVTMLFVNALGLEQPHG